MEQLDHYKLALLDLGRAPNAEKAEGWAQQGGVPDEKVRAIFAAPINQRLMTMVIPYRALGATGLCQ